jgi:hypothetical protein
MRANRIGLVKIAKYLTGGRARVEGLSRRSSDAAKADSRIL